MSIFTWADKKIQSMCPSMRWFDYKIIGLFCILVGILVAKWIPSLLTVNGWWYIAVAVLCLLRIFYLFFLKKEKSN